MVAVTLLIHSSALFYWGGKVTENLRNQNTRIERLEDQWDGMERRKKSRRES